MLIKDLQETHISARDARNAIHKNHFPNGIVLLWFYFTSDYFLILNTWGNYKFDVIKILHNNVLTTII